MATPQTLLERTVPSNGPHTPVRHLYPLSVAQGLLLALRAEAWLPAVSVSSLCSLGHPAEGDSTYRTTVSKFQTVCHPSVGRPRSGHMETQHIHPALPLLLANCHGSSLSPSLLWTDCSSPFLSLLELAGGTDCVSSPWLTLEKTQV